MIKQTLKYLSLAGLLISNNLQASTRFLQEPDAQRCINHVRMAEAQRVQPQWLLTYLAKAHDLDFPVLEALEHTGLHLHQIHQISHEDVVTFLKGIRAYQNTNRGAHLNLDLPEDSNQSINKIAQAFNPTVPFKMNLCWANLRSILPLVSCLSKLTELDLYRNKLTDVRPLTNLTSLTTLQLGVNMLTDVRPLTTLTGLTTLQLGVNKLTDVGPLTTLTSLTILHLEGNQLTDVSPLVTLTGLTTLGLSNNQLTDLSLLDTLTSLTTLHLHDNQLTDVSPLATLTGLTTLGLSNNQITNVRPLTTLASLRTLHLDDNQLTDVSPLGTLASLRTLFLVRNPSVSSQNLERTLSMFLSTVKIHYLRKV